MNVKFFLSILISLGILSCNSNDSNSTTLTSKDVTDKSQRINILKKEVKIFSELKDAEFYLINANGFSNQRISVPGASSLNYQFVIKIDTNDISKWTEGMTETSGYSNWMDELLISRKENWNMHSIPKVFTRIGDSVIMFVYNDEGIIYKKLWSN